MDGVSQIAVGNLIPIDLNSLIIDSTLDFNLYLKVEDEYVLFRAPSMPFTEKTRETLVNNGVLKLYIPEFDKKQFQSYIEENLKEIIADESITEESKSVIIYDTAKMMVKDLLEKPTLPENMRRSLSLVESTTSHLLKSQETFHNMLQIMSFDYSIYTHSVNVCTIALALGQKIGINSKEELHHLGTGALLHDLGKSKISEDILGKHGPLTDEEMNLIKRHPQYGFEIVIKSEIIPHDAHYPILQHHEREDGTGYPHKLGSSDIHFYSKIVAIADVFDAMTSRRPYREAKDAFAALSEMYNSTDKYDKSLLRELTQMLGPKNN